MINDVVAGGGATRPVVDCNGQGPDRDRLIGVLEETRTGLRRLGIGREDRVVLVGRDGLEMATLFLAISGAAACAPLPPTLPTLVTNGRLTSHISRTAVEQTPARIPVSIPAKSTVPKVTIQAKASGKRTRKTPQTFRVVMSPLATFP